MRLAAILARFDRDARVGEQLSPLKYFRVTLVIGGSLGLIIAARYGPISIVTPLIGSYPVVTLVFAVLVLKERIARR